MKRYWAVKKRLVQNDKLIIKGARKVAIAKGDEILVLSNAVSGLFFEWHAKVAELVDPMSVDDRYTVFTYVLKDRSNIEAQPSLKDLAYTLRKVYRYQRPHVHFLRPYVSLPATDYEAIVEDRIFWSRTAFGLFVSRLPGQVFDAFQRDVAEYSPQLLFRSSYREVWARFRQFVIGELLTAQGLLDATRSLCQEAERDGLGGVFANLRLYDEDENTSMDSVAAQLEKLDAFVASIGAEEGQSSLLDQLQIQIEASDWEEKYDEIFEGRKWQDLRVS